MKNLSINEIKQVSGGIFPVGLVVKVVLAAAVPVLVEAGIALGDYLSETYPPQGNTGGEG